MKSSTVRAPPTTTTDHHHGPPLHGPPLHLLRATIPVETGGALGGGTGVALPLPRPATAAITTATATAAACHPTRPNPISPSRVHHERHRPPHDEHSYLAFPRKHHLPPAFPPKHHLARWMSIGIRGACSLPNPDPGGLVPSPPTIRAVQISYFHFSGTSRFRTSTTAPCCRLAEP